MTQIIEYTKHSDNYLIYHFEFECNDKSAIGNFAGNCSLNKFMSLNDWHRILDYLNDPVENYVKNPFRKPIEMVRQIDNSNLELHIQWMDMDALYSKLLSSVDFDLVFPFVIKVKVALRSNVNDFVSNSPAILEKSSDRKKTSERKETVDKAPQMPILPLTATANGDSGKTIKLRECCVRLPILEFDGNGKVIQNQNIRNKRKHHSLATDDIQPVKLTPKIHNETNDLFMGSSSSTPFARNFGVALKQIEDEVRGTFGIPNQKTAKHLTNRLTTTTPRTSNDRKSGSLSFNPRIRLLKLPENVNRPSISKKSKQKNTGKRQGKSKVKSTTIKRPKPRAQSIANETEYFEKPLETQKSKKARTKLDQKKSPPVIPDIIKLEERSLKSMTNEDLWKSFDDHYEVISNLFLSYLKQTDATVRKADDYNHFDMISLFTTDQFSVMLDILFEKFVKIGEFGEICYDALFLELLIPEWALAIYMQRYSLDREAAIKRVSEQRSDDGQTYESYTTIVSIKLDDTMNSNRTQNID